MFLYYELGPSQLMSSNFHNNFVKKAVWPYFLMSCTKYQVSKLSGFAVSPGQSAGEQQISLASNLEPFLQYLSQFLPLPAPGLAPFY